MKINRTVSVAPMMDCTDRHERFFLRLMSKNVMLYTEMVATKSAILGDRKKILGFNKIEKPLALQVGGSNQKELIEVCKIAEDMGYDEININLGCPSKKGDHIGPVISKVQYDKIINLIESGISEGATLAAGGPELPNGLNKGYFIKPTIFTDVTNEMRIAKEEIFGPVLSIIPFDTEDEAVKIVNDTSYGLGNYLQTDNKEKAHRVAKKLRSGCVYINGNAADVGTPFGGYRQSGNGREGGVWGLEEFLEVKNVTGWN